MAYTDGKNTAFLLNDFIKAVLHLSKYSMTQQPWYIDWFNSPYYYQLYSNRNESEIETFVPNLINYLNPEPGSRMLDVACGRGRFSKILAALGFDVTGTDISKSAIAFARQFESENLHFYSHDLRLPFWINYFDYVFNFFTSFGYFRTRREHEDAIRTVCKSLNNTGTLVIDYLNVYYSEKRLVPTEKKPLTALHIISNDGLMKLIFIKRLVSKIRHYHTLKNSLRKSPGLHWEILLTCSVTRGCRLILFLETTN